MESERINLVGSNSNSNSGKGGSKKGRKVITLTALKKKELQSYPPIVTPSVPPKPVTIGECDYIRGSRACKTI